MIIIQKIRNLKVFVSNIRNSSTKWMRFLLGLYACKTEAGIVLFHVENWQFGWHLGAMRHLTYREIIGRRKTLFIDLNSTIMVWLATLKLGQPQVTNSEYIDVEMLKRQLWDQVLRHLPGDRKGANYQKFKRSLDNCHDYLALYHDVTADLANCSQKKLHAVSLLLRANCIDGVAVIQTAYIDQYFRIMAKQFGKKTYLPEHLYGFYVGSDLGTSLDKKIYERYSGEITENDVKNAINAIKNRLCGKYSKSNLGFYMLDNEVDSSIDIKPKFHGKKNIIYFLHAFTDSPNVGLSSNEDMCFVDHYHFFLSFHDTFKEIEDVNIYIKPHPSHERYPGDGVFFKKVLEVCENSSNFYLMPSNLTIGSLFGQDMNESLYCLSGYGSVTVECAYLGYTVINYKSCIYTEFGLSKFIKTPEEIRSFLGSGNRNPKSANGRDLAISVEAFKIWGARQHIFSGAELSEKESRLLDLVVIN